MEPTRRRARSDHGGWRCRTSPLSAREDVLDRVTLAVTDFVVVVLDLEI